MKTTTYLKPRLVFAVCPKCGSRDVMLLPSNEYVCRKCGYKWPMPQADYTWIEAKKAKLFEKFATKSVYIRYVLPYDAGARRYTAVHKSDTPPQYLANALYELEAGYLPEE